MVTLECAGVVSKSYASESGQSWNCEYEQNVRIRGMVESCFPHRSEIDGRILSQGEVKAKYKWAFAANWDKFWLQTILEFSAR